VERDRSEDGESDEPTSAEHDAAVDGEAVGLDGYVEPAGEHQAVPPSSALPPKLEAWRRRSATGAILTGLALGFQQALEAPREQPSIMIETSGTPPRDLPVDAEVEVLRPRQSIVSIRPWLIEGSNREAASPGDRDGVKERRDDPPGSEPSSTGQL